MGSKGSNYQTPLLVIGIIVALVVLAPNILQLSVVPIEDYGTVELYNDEDNTRINTVTVLDAQQDEDIVVWLKSDSNTQRDPTSIDWTVTLRLSDVMSTWVADSGSVYKDGQDLKWVIQTDSCLSGTNTYHVLFFGMIGDTDLDVGGPSLSFQVTNMGDPVYPDAVWTARPAYRTYVVTGEPLSLTWKLNYQGAFTATININDVDVWSESHDASFGEKLLIYSVDTSVIGKQSLIMTIAPTGIDNPILTSFEIVHVVDEIPTTTPTTNSTDTTTTTTDPTTTTGTTDPPPVPPPDNLMLYGLIAGVGLAVIVVLARRK